MTDAEHNALLPEMADEELIRAYCAFEDHEHLSPEQQALVAEMERRDLEL